MKISPVIIALVVAAGIGGYLYWQQPKVVELPAGLAEANGRIEVERVDVSTKVGGRLAEVLVREGDFVAQDQVVARMDVSDLMAQLASARAAVRRAEEGVGMARAELGSREADLKLREVEVLRATGLGSDIMA